MRRNLLEFAGPLVALGLIVLVVAATTPTFLSGQNFNNMALQASVLAIVALGSTVVILTGGIDLSPGSMIALLTMFLAVMMKLEGYPVWLTIIIVIGLSLIEVAYQVEINRAALSAVAPGQIDAGEALGFTPLQIFFQIRLPQAARIALPPTVNEFITLLKSTSIATVISLRELMTVAQQAVTYSYRYAEYYSAALLYYVAMVLVLMIVQKNIERRLSWVQN